MTEPQRKEDLKKLELRIQRLERYLGLYDSGRPDVIFKKGHPLYEMINKLAKSNINEREMILMAIEKFINDNYTLRKK